MDIEYRLGRDDILATVDYLRGIRLQYNRRAAPWVRALAIGAVAGLLTWAAIASLADNGGDDPRLWIAAALLLLTALAFRSLQRWAPADALRWLGRYEGTYRLQVGPAGLASAGPAGPRWIDWPEIRALAQTDRCLLLHLAAARVLAIPRSAFASDAALRQFTGLVRAYWAEHPGNRGACLGDGALAPGNAAKALLRNLAGGLRLVCFRPLTAGDFKAGAGQLFWLVLLLAMLGAAVDYLFALPEPSFTVYGLTSQGSRIGVFLASAAVIAAAAGEPRSAMRLLAMLAAAQFYLSLPYQILASGLDTLELSLPNPLDWSLYLLFLVWGLAVTYRAVSLQYGLPPRGAVFLAGVFAVLNHIPALYLPPPALFYRDWSEQDESGAARLNVEDTFYAQADLLADATRALLPQRPGVTDLYFLGFAGEADEHVFANEVHYARDLIDRRFDTRGRSLVLINNHESVATTPLASAHNLERALAAVARRMNPEEDVLFLFLTSHGSRDHELSVRFWPLDLNAIPAATLKQMLDRSGIRHRVILISACFSGGFLDVLKDEDSLIMTAAHRARQSFGCGTASDFTYFGEAYFTRALAHHRSFAAAFEEARDDIQRRERAENKTPSEPQIHLGSRIASKLRDIESRAPAPRQGAGDG